MTCADDIKEALPGWEYVFTMLKNIFSAAIFSDEKITIMEGDKLKTNNIPFFQNYLEYKHQQ